MIVNGAIKIGYMKVDGTITKSWTKYENEFREHNGHYSTKRVAKFYRTFSYDIDGKTYTNTTKGINPEVLPEKITILVNPDNYLESYIADDISMNFNMGIIIIILGFLFISFIIIVNVIRILIKYRW